MYIINVIKKGINIKDTLKLYMLSCFVVVSHTQNQKRRVLKQL
jgi:hypothetical protein